MWPAPVRFSEFQHQIGGQSARHGRARPKSCRLQAKLAGQILAKLGQLRMGQVRSRGPQLKRSGTMLTEVVPDRPWWGQVGQIVGKFGTMSAAKVQKSLPGAVFELGGNSQFLPHAPPPRSGEQFSCKLFATSATCCGNMLLLLLLGCVLDYADLSRVPWVTRPTIAGPAPTTLTCVYDA